MDFKPILQRLFNLAQNETHSSIEEVGEEMTGETGFLSFRRKLRIKKGYSTINIFLKFSDTSRQELGELKEFSDHFCPRECLFYGTFAPLLERTASQLGLGSVGLPTVHLEMVLPTGTLIVMEDLGEAGFELAPATMNVAEARCVLSSLARVQAAFWLTKARLGSPASGLFGPESPFSDPLKSLTGTAVNFDAFLEQGFEEFRHKFDNYLKCEKRAAIVNAYLEDGFLEKTRKVLKVNQEKSEVVGVIHCDLWYNNCMISRDSRGQPIECRLIDWQFFGIGWLTYDLGPLWISSIDNAIVTQEFLPCVDFYHHAVQSAYESAIGEKFPVSQEQMRQQAVQSLVYGIGWVILSADTLWAFQSVSNVLANIADVIEHFKL
ncbi:hypothetical protein BOX15_Mlig009006g1 [Macrostomum lignano]|uniref:CHK kinase-like domain-containing protein n=1 Tax=Macrostomum lignano TaxID=282301 RepID=A0A267EWQ2_9PLAT|nr:hypothetical protein BOX15_Mlig009006g3 [Macrostomum lignano]PAA65424.1 hypothetical protein BOX15_Mlig009006g1 [Macrostomum lignano]